MTHSHSTSGDLKPARKHARPFAARAMPREYTQHAALALIGGLLLLLAIELLMIVRTSSLLGVVSRSAANDRRHAPAALVAALQSA